MLSKTERKFLEQKLAVNDGYKNKLRHSIKMKLVQMRKDLELLLNQENREFINNFKQRYIYEKKQNDRGGEYMDFSGTNPTMVSELSLIQKLLANLDYCMYSGISDKARNYLDE